MGPRSFFKRFVQSSPFRILLCLIALVFLCTDAAPCQSFWDKLRDKAQDVGSRAREQWQQSGHPCASCGKTIHVGSKCASCVAREQADRARSKWEESAHPCASCGKMIHVGTKCATCVTREKAEQAKAKWEQSAHPCVSCGQMIHVGTKCASCIANEKAEAAKKAWEERTHPCASCGKPIHLGSKCVTCISKEQLEKGRMAFKESEHPCASCGKPIHLGVKCTRCLAAETVPRIKEQFSRLEANTRKNCQKCGKVIHGRDYCLTCVAQGAIRENASLRKGRCGLCGKPTLVGNACGICALYVARQKMELGAANVSAVYQHSVKRYVSDPENQKKALSTIATVEAIWELEQTVPRNVTVAALTYMGKNVNVRYGGREMCLEDCSRRLIEKHAPYLVGSSIYEDPAKAVTYALIFQDRDYIVNDLKIVKTGDGRHVSLADAALKSSALQTTEVEQALDAIESYEEFRDQSLALTELDASSTLLQSAITSLGRR